jgi:UTP--glucose-1-phosphate uridylyltransferase
MVVQPVPERDGELPFVELDKRFYRVLEEFEPRFPHGAPSLREADRLVVDGDVTFGADVVVRGAVQLEAEEPVVIADGSTLAG